MKIKTSIKSVDLQKGEFMVRRRGKLFRINKKNPKRNARQG